jgi:hypothetical protein
MGEYSGDENNVILFAAGLCNNCSEALMEGITKQLHLEPISKTVNKIEGGSASGMSALQYPFPYQQFGVKRGNVRACAR